MIKELLYKHSLVGLNNGVVLEGFVQTGDEKYFKMVELDNSIVIVRIDDISFARLVSGDKKSYVNPPISSSQPAVQSGGVIDEISSDSNICPKTSSYPPHPFTRVYGPVKVYKPAPEQEAQTTVVPPIELDEEGFAIGLPRGATTMDYPFSKPSLGKVVKSG